MSSYAYQIEDSDLDEFILEREYIETETDPDILNEWRRGLEDRDDILSMQIETFKLNPREDRESLLWFNRVCMAKAATGIGMTRLKRRMIRLGMIEDPQARQIASLESKLLTAKAEIVALQERLAA
jgi:hypothetical protein